MLDLIRTGPLYREANGKPQVKFRLPLPGIDDRDPTLPKFEVNVYVIPLEKRFTPGHGAVKKFMHRDPTNDFAWGDLKALQWETDWIDMQDYPQGILYRFEVAKPKEGNRKEQVLCQHFGDPFAKEGGIGTFSSFHPFRDGGNAGFDWEEKEKKYRTPATADLVLYEINVESFNGTFEGIIERLDYLEGLGINGLCLMPVTGIAEPSNWGYMPVSYFTPEERFGSPNDLRRLVRECHKRNIAVILDAVYAHSESAFPYEEAYKPFFPLWDDHINTNNPNERSPQPLKCDYENFGKKFDWRMETTQEFFQRVNEFWLTEFHVDGFRYDHVSGFIDKRVVNSNRDLIRSRDVQKDFWNNFRPSFSALTKLTCDTFAFTRNDPTLNKYPRFKDSHVIQIAEDLGQAPYQLGQFSNSAITGCWDKTLFDKTHEIAQQYKDFLHSGLAEELLLRRKSPEKIYAARDMDIWDRLPGRADVQNFAPNGAKLIQYSDTYGNEKQETIFALPVQYIESHDEKRLMARMVKCHDDPFSFKFGLHGLEWWRLQPYAIALMTSVGTPMLYAGQEFAENYLDPGKEQARVRANQPLHWSYCYNPDPKESDTLSILPLLHLYRKLGTLRHNLPALRGGRDQAQRIYEHCDNGLLAYKRWTDKDVVLVLLNFHSSNAATIPLHLPHKGMWVDILESALKNEWPPENSVTSQDKYPGGSAFRVEAKVDGDFHDIQVPSHFGRILRLCRI